MRICVFDTETTGLPKDRQLNLMSRCASWPHILQLSWVLYDTDTHSVITWNRGRDIVRIPRSVNIPADATRIHSISRTTTDRSRRNMVTLLRQFHDVLKQADMIVGHNLEFDTNCVRVEAMRLVQRTKTHHSTAARMRRLMARLNELFGSHRTSHCTMKTTSSRLGSSKWLRLEELHRKLFPTDHLAHLHNAFNDVVVTLRCYMQAEQRTDVLAHCSAIREVYPRKLEIAHVIL